MLLYFVSVVCVYKDILIDMLYYSLCIYIYIRVCVIKVWMGKGGGYLLGCG